MDLHLISPGRPEPSQPADPGTIASLKAQAAELRLELARMHRDLAELKRDFGEERAAQLLEANERLVLSSLHAEFVAETAVSDLGELARTSQRDALTDTPGRALMSDRVENAISSARRRGARMALLFIDVDRFKQVNDTFGHDVGDRALQMVARRLESAVRESDSVSRHGGDEFLVLLADVAAPSDAAVIVGRMLGAIAEPISLGDRALQLSVSIGIAMYPEHGEDMPTLVARADAAMYQSKRRGPAGFRFHGEPGLVGQSLELFPGATPARGAALADPTAHVPRVHDLQEANERLVLSALDAEDLEARAEALNRQQLQVLAMVAHELRNPLAPIRLATDLLMRFRSDEPRFTRQHQIIKRQVGYMTRLIEDLLDGSRLTTGRLRVERVKLDLADVLAMTIESCRPAIAQRLHRLTTDLAPGPLPIAGDALRLAQVFANLLDNASKYTPIGGSVRVESMQSGSNAIVSIIDKGIGISPEALPKIFELFNQDARAVAVDGRGLGIGLAVVRDLVQAHGGSVVGSSAGADLGSRFVVTLPLAPG